MAVTLVRSLAGRLEGGLGLRLQGVASGMFFLRVHKTSKELK